MKNYYFKVVLIALFAFIFTCFFDNKSFAGFFLEGEYHNEPVPMSSLMNETSWDSMQSYISDVWGLDFPTWSQASAVDDILEDIAMFYVGQAVSVSETVASNVANSILDSTSTVYDIWDMIAFDGDSCEFVKSSHYSDEDLTNVIHGVVDPYIYTIPSGGAIGNWLPLPVYNIRFSPWPDINNQFVNVEGNSCYIACAPSSYILAYKGGQVSGSNVRRDGVGGYQYYTCNEFYQGSLDSGYFVASYGYDVVSGLTPYSDVSTALIDFFGNDSFDEPYLNGQGLIINDNPNYKPVTAYSVLNYDYSTHIVNNYNTGEPITWPVGVNTVRSYTYDYKGIYWDFPTLDTLEYPSEIEFPSVEFETIEIDESVDNALEDLNGSWIVEFFLVAILLLILGLIL